MSWINFKLFKLIISANKLARLIVMKEDAKATGSWRKPRCCPVVSQRKGRAKNLTSHHGSSSDCIYLSIPARISVWQKASKNTGWADSRSGSWLINLRTCARLERVFSADGIWKIIRWGRAGIWWAIKATTISSNKKQPHFKQQWNATLFQGIQCKSASPPAKTATSYNMIMLLHDIA